MPIYISAGRNDGIVARDAVGFVCRLGAEGLERCDLFSTLVARLHQEKIQTVVITVSPLSQSTPKP